MPGFGLTPTSDAGIRVEKRGGERRGGDVGDWALYRKAFFEGYERSVGTKIFCRFQAGRRGMVTVWRSGRPFCDE